MIASLGGGLEGEAEAEQEVDYMGIFMKQKWKQ